MSLFPQSQIAPDSLPTAGSDWSEYAGLAVTFDPVAAFGSPEYAVETARSMSAHWRRTGELRGTIDDLRAALWFERRRWRYLGRDPDAETMRFCAAIVRALRSLL
jgi:hypothetical protein